MNSVNNQNKHRMIAPIFAAAACLLGSMATPAFAKVTCPSSVKGGHPLEVTIIYENSDCNNSLVIADTVSSVIANSSGASGMGGIGVHGPVVTATPITLPAATCNMDGTVENSTHTTANFKVHNKIPAALDGSLVMVMVMAEESNGKIKGVGECYANVTK